MSYQQCCAVCLDVYDRDELDDECLCPSCAVIEEVCECCGDYYLTYDAASDSFLCYSCRCIY